MKNDPPEKHKLIKGEEDPRIVSPVSEAHGTILGRLSDDEVVSLTSNYNQNTLVLGNSGSGKSFCFARTSIIQSILQGTSIIVSDVGGELYDCTSEFAKEHGYTIKILNLASPIYSDSWDAMGAIAAASNPEYQVKNFVSAMLRNGYEMPKGTPDTFTEVQEDLLEAVVLYVAVDDSFKGKRKFRSVFKLLNEEPEELADIFSSLSASSLAQKPWRKAWASGKASLSAAQKNLTIKLRAMRDEVILNITGYDDIDLSKLRETKCAYYIIMSDTRRDYTFLSSLFLTQLLDRMAEDAMKKKDCPVPVSFVLDEFTTIGELPNLGHTFNSLTHTGTNVSILCQSLPQLRAAYPNNHWEPVIENCHTVVSFSCCELLTARLLVSMNCAASVSPDKVFQLASGNKVLIAVQGSDLMVGDKFPYTELVDTETLTLADARLHKPMWRIARDSAE